MCGRSVTRGAAQPATARPASSAHASAAVHAGEPDGRVGGRRERPALVCEHDRDEVALASVADSGDSPAPPTSSSYSVIGYEQLVPDHLVALVRDRPADDRDVRTADRGIGDDAQLSPGP